MSEKQRKIKLLADFHITVKNMEDDIVSLEEDLHKNHRVPESELEKIQENPYDYN